MEPNFRHQLLHSGEEEYRNEASVIRMISAPSSAISPSRNTNCDPAETTLQKSDYSYSPVKASARRPLVSPPPPPTDSPFQSASSPWCSSSGSMSQEEHSEICTNFCDFDDEDPGDSYLGSQLPPGFSRKTTSRLLEELAEAEALLSVQRATSIVRDLDTITEVSETDDLTSLSSNGDNAGVKSHTSDSYHWTSSSTARRDSSPKAASDCYRLASTVTACSSSSETVNDEDTHAAGPASSAPSGSSHRARTAFSPSGSREKIDHASTRVVIGAKRAPDDHSEIHLEQVRTACLPEENGDQFQFDRDRGVAGQDDELTTNSAEDDFVTEPAPTEAEPVGSSNSRHDSIFLDELNHCETGAVFVEENGVCFSVDAREAAVAEDNGSLENVGPEFESFSSRSSSGRTSIATDLPIDESGPVSSTLHPTPNGLFEFATAEQCQILPVSHERSDAAVSVKDDLTEFLPSGDIENRSSEETSSSCLISNISQGDIADTVASGEAECKNNDTNGISKLGSSSEQCVVLEDDQPSASLSSWPTREHRLLLAYQKYHNLKTEAGIESDLSNASPSYSSSEPTKTTFLKQENSSRDIAITTETTDRCMDQIDLQKALERFARYGELYGDAPRSGMEEFGANKNSGEDSVDAASRMSSLPSTGSTAKMEALLKSTLQTKGSTSSHCAANTGSASPASLTMKRDCAGDDSLLNRDRGRAGAVHALASTISTVNGAASCTAYNNQGGATTAAENSNKTKARVLSSYDGEFQSSSSHRVVELHDKNRYSARPASAAAVSRPSSGQNNAPANSNQVGICVTKLNRNPADIQTSQERDRGIRPTSAPLTPLLPTSGRTDWTSVGCGGVLSKTYEQSTEPVCVASATSQAIINDPESIHSQSALFSSKTPRKILAEASANAVASNPYIALARATTAAASKVAEASNENLLDVGESGTVSLIVSSTVTTTKRDFFSTTKSTPDLLFFSSNDVSGFESRKERPEMSYTQQSAVQVTPTYGVIPRGTASIFQQRHRDLSPGGRGGVRSPERKRQNYGYEKDRLENDRSPATTRSRSANEEKKALFASSDHLQQLLEDPYYAKEQQKPVPAIRTQVANVPGPTSQATSPTAVPLSQRNISDWNSRPENSLQNQRQQNLLRWRNSMNLAENEELRQAMLEDQKAEKEMSKLSPAKSGLEDSMESYYGTESKRSSSAMATTPGVELWDYKIFREEQKKADTELDEEGRKNRRNKYKAKIERAKKDYLSTKASASDLYRSIEDFEKKFNISMENVRLPDPPRGPYLEYLSKSGNLHVIDVNDLPPPAYVRPKPRFDREYESIVRNAEERWSAYKRRLHAAASKHGDDLYARSRAYSMGFLETDIDEETPRNAGQKSIVETDLDKVQREIEHEGRKRSKTPAASSNGANATGRTVHSRAKSADFLMDQRGRTEIEPPENQLQKILGEKDEKDLSEHELRFRKSTEKLPVPDWYLNSDQCAGGKPPSSDQIGPRQSGHPSERPKSTQSHYAYPKGPADAASPQSYRKSQASTPSKFQDNTSSRYVSPWVYGGRISGPEGMKTPEPTQRRVQSPSPKSSHTTPRKVTDSPPKPSARPPTSVKQPQPLRPEPRKIIEHEKREYHSVQTSTTTSTMYSISKSVTEKPLPQSPRQQKQEFALPKHFFDKYKDEIEEMRKSRTALNNIKDIDDDEFLEEQRQKRLSAQGLPVPVATVRPTQLHEEDFDTTASLSFSPTSSPESRPASKAVGTIGAPTPQPRSHHRQPQQTPTPRAVPTNGLNKSPYRDTPLNTSTPYSSELLPRKQAPVSRETAFEPYHHQQDHPPSYPAPQPPQLARQSSFRTQEPRHMPGGWTVTAVPPDWNVPGQRDSVVIEVAGDGLFDAGSAGGPKGRRMPSNLTLEEVLDSVFALPVTGKSVLTTIDESSSSLLDDVLPMRPRTPTNLEGPGIYTQNQGLMDKCIEEPELATDLLKRETLWVKCGYCSRTRQLEDARVHGFVSCHHCYTYYCNRTCRRCDWDRHLDICSYARINTLCKQVILKVRQDTESQFQMSRVAQRGYQSRGRGSVNFRFLTLTLAKNYVKDNTGGWRSLRSPPNDPAEFLHYYTVPDLVDARKDHSLITLCRNYDPRSKFVLSVSIMADIEECPETPPPEAVDDQAYSKQQSWYQRGIGNTPTVTSNTRPTAFSGSEFSWMTDAKKPYHTNGVSKDDIYDYQPPQGQYFVRGDQYRHTVAATPRSAKENNGHWASSTNQQGRPGLLIGPEDADETEV